MTQTQVEEMYRLDCQWGCGALFVKEGKVVRACPIFQKFVGASLAYLKAAYGPQSVAGPYQREEETR